jgi:spore germination cell wall hydrolase CwlJ-like protein
MYQGELLVMGDPTVKPYDLVDICDLKTEMVGLCEVKEVVHHFSEQTGFITSVTPDLCVVNDDSAAVVRYNLLNAAILPTVLELITLASIRHAERKLGFAHPLTSLASHALKTTMAGLKVGRRFVAKTGEVMTNQMTKGATKKVSGKVFRAVENAGSKTGKKLLKMIHMEDAVNEAVKILTGSADVAEKGAGKVAAEAIKESKIFKAGKVLAKGATEAPAKIGKAAMSAGKIGFIVEAVVLEAICSGIGEMFGRNFRNREAVIMLPLKQKGINLTAGINGHMGCVYGEAKSAWDQWISKWSGVLDVVFPGAKWEIEQVKTDDGAMDSFAVKNYDHKKALAIEESSKAAAFREEEYRVDSGYSLPKLHGHGVRVKFSGRHPMLDDDEKSMTKEGISYKQHNLKYVNFDKRRYTTWHNWTVEDKLALALIIMVEASRGKTDGCRREQLAVGAVIVNRLKRSPSSSILGVISHGFEAFTNHRFDRENSEKGKKDIPKEYLDIADQCMSGYDITQGAYYFCNREICIDRGTYAGWLSGTDGRVVRIGAQVFARRKDGK